MAEGAYGKMGMARMYALIFGIAYLAVGLLELVYGFEDPLALGETVVIAGATLHTIIHLAVGVVVLGSFFAGESAAKSVARVIGVVFLVVLILNFVATDFYSKLVGFPEDYGLPGVYYVAHALIAAGALFAGFSNRGGYGSSAAA